MGIGNSSLNSDWTASYGNSMVSAAEQTKELVSSGNYSVGGVTVKSSGNSGTAQKSSTTATYQPTDYREEAPARGPEDLGRVAGNVVSAFKMSDDTIGLVFLGALGIFLLRMFGK